MLNAPLLGSHPGSASMFLRITVASVRPQGHGASRSQIEAAEGRHP